MAIPSPLVFGLELWFYGTILRHQAAAVADSFPQDLSLVQLLAQRLQLLPLAGPDGSGCTFRQESDDEVDADAEALADDGVAATHAPSDTWVIAPDPSVHSAFPTWFQPRGNSGYPNHSYKVVSPAYPLASPFWEADVERMFSASRNSQSMNSIIWYQLPMYSEFKHTNIHLGYGNLHEPLPFHTVRNVALIVLVYETEMRKLLDHTFSATLQATGARQPVYLSHSGSPFFAPLGATTSTPRAALAEHLLRHCHDIPSVVAAMNPAVAEPEQYPFLCNLTNLVDPEACPSGSGIDSNGKSVRCRRIRTIQFRFQNGMLDPDTLVPLLKFLGGLVTLASIIDDERLFELLGGDVGAGILPGAGIRGRNAFNSYHANGGYLLTPGMRGSTGGSGRASHTRSSSFPTPAAALRWLFKFMTDMYNIPLDANTERVLLRKASMT